MTAAGPKDPRLQQLVEGVVKLASGDLSARIPPSEARDEIDAVITGVNLLAEELHYIYSDLEQRVAERTAELIQAQAELRRMAMTDALTGLANRSRLRERIIEALDTVQHGGRPPALMMLDLDSFKTINDNLGHGAGDEVLVEVAGRLRASVRETDTVARLGGDEFAILVPNANEDDVRAIAHRVLRSLQRSITVGSASVWAMGSIGVSIGSEGDTAATLQRDADVAMYVAKSRGRNNVQLFVPSMLEATQERSRTAAELRSGLETGQLSLYYQPVIALATGRIIGLEALVRWRHPERGMVLPDTFIPLAEETGLIVDIGRWALAEALPQLKAWNAVVPGMQDVKLHVNLSAAELLRKDLLDDVAGTLTRCGIAPAQLVFEITETVLMTRETEEAQVLAKLSGLGVGLQIDDFGTGYSSISYLRSLPADTVKVDQSLIKGIDADQGQRDFVAAVLQLIRSAGLQAIVEGIETSGEAARLRELGCVYGQGFHFSRPVPADAVVSLFNADFPPA